ncbi:MAG: hypothetical protein NE330_02665 [Lentisphaeraceae bacterium]|nr:hypothetical protein [Lentisphaeraceae bacterium]
MIKFLGCLLVLVVSTAAVEQGPKMMAQGEVILESDFTDANALTKANFQTRKETHHSIEDGKLKLISPKMAYKGNPPEKSKWADATMSRMAFKDVIPQDYAVSFRFKANEPKDEKAKRKVSFFFEFGHRCVRLEMKTEGTQLLIMNHLTGHKNYIVLEEKKDFKLTTGQWYDVFAEIKGEEILVQVNDKTFYGKHELIKKTRPKALQFNNGGAGFDLDHIKLWKAGSFNSDWQKERP